MARTLYFLILQLFILAYSIQANACELVFSKPSYQALANAAVDKYAKALQLSPHSPFRNPELMLADPLRFSEMTLPYEIALLGALGEIPLPRIGRTRGDLATYVQILNHNGTSLANTDLVYELISDKLHSPDVYTRVLAAECLVNHRDRRFVTLMEIAAQDKNELVKGWGNAALTSIRR